MKTTILTFLVVSFTVMAVGSNAFAGGGKEIKKEKQVKQAEIKQDAVETSKAQEGTGRDLSSEKIEKSTPPIDTSVEKKEQTEEERRPFHHTGVLENRF